MKFTKKMLRAAAKAAKNWPRNYDCVSMWEYAKKRGCG